RLDARFPYGEHMCRNLQYEKVRVRLFKNLVGTRRVVNPPITRIEQGRTPVLRNHGTAGNLNAELVLRAFGAVCQHARPAHSLRRGHEFSNLQTAKRLVGRQVAERAISPGFDFQGYKMLGNSIRPGAARLEPPQRRSQPYRGGSGFRGLRHESGHSVDLTS